MLDPEIGITIHIPAFHGGGAENALARLANHWSSEGRKVRFVVNDAIGPVRERIDPNVEVISLGTLATRTALPRLVRWVRADRPRLLITALPSANIAGAVATAFTSGTTTVALVRNHTTTELKNDSAKARYLLGPALRWALRAAHGVGCVSTSVAGDAVKFARLDPSRVFTTFNAVPPVTREFAPPPHRDEPLILAVGRLEPQKDFSTLIEAFARLTRTRPARLRIVGEGQERAALTQLCQRLGVADRVELPGFTGDVEARIAEADVFVLPSRFEGFPNVLVEALAMGKTTVATDAPGGSAEILGEGRFGYLARVGDAASIAEALDRALAEPLPGNFVRESTERFKITEVASRYECGFAKALAREKLK